MPPFDLDAWVARSGALDLDAIHWADVATHADLHAGHREPHHHLFTLAAGDARGGRPGGLDVPGVLAARGDLPRHRALPLSRVRRPSGPATGDAARAGAARQAAGVVGDVDGLQ